ncbi:uncharacterized protein LOC129131773 isoform X9 [Agelaius phoeniceus]|uniref:uncharacterized protein LOC129131773 isoform X9 n=1 Tax=Agelaius phoeniceus TaxID=39638 RepID=UPI0040552DBC
MTPPRIQTWLSPSCPKLDAFVPFLGKYHRPVSGRCCQTCTPRSWDGFYPKDLAPLGFRDASRLTEADTRFRGWLVRRVCGFLAAWEWEIPAESPGKLLERICSSRRVQDAASSPEPGSRGDEGSQRCCREEIRQILGEIQAPLSPLLLRLCHWLLPKLLTRVFLSVQLHRGQLEMVLQAARTPKVPLVFLCSHQSPLDGPLLSFLLLSQGVGLPRVAVSTRTSPRLRSLLQRLGGIFLPSGMAPTWSDRDEGLPGAVLDAYVQEVLRSRQPLVLFLEEPSALLRLAEPARRWLLRLLRALRDGAVPDALLVPVGIAYDVAPGGLERAGAVRGAQGVSSAPQNLWETLLPSIPGEIPRERHSPISGSVPGEGHPPSVPLTPGCPVLAAPGAGLVSQGGVPGPALPAPWLCPGGFLSAVLLTGICGQQPGGAHPHRESPGAAAASHHPGQGPTGCEERGEFRSRFGDRRGDFGDGAGAACTERFQSLLCCHSRGNHRSPAAAQAPGGGRRVWVPLSCSQSSIPSGNHSSPPAAFPVGIPSPVSPGGAAAQADAGFLGAAGAAAAAGPGRELLGAAAGAAGAQPAPSAAPAAPAAPPGLGPGTAGMAGRGGPAPAGRGGRGRLCHPCPAAGDVAHPGAALQPHQDHAEPGRAAPQDPGAAAAAAPHPAGAPGGDTGLACHPQPCWGHGAGLSPLCCVPSPAGLLTATAWTSWTSSSLGGCWRRKRRRGSAGAVMWPRGASGRGSSWASSRMTATVTASTASPSSATRAGLRGGTAGIPGRGGGWASRQEPGPELPAEFQGHGGAGGAADPHGTHPAALPAFPVRFQPGEAGSLHPAVHPAVAPRLINTESNGSWIY